MTLTKSLASLALVAGSFGFVACNELIQDITTQEGLQTAVQNFAEQVDTTKYKIYSITIRTKAKPGNEFSNSVGKMEAGVITATGDTIYLRYSDIHHKVSEEKPINAKLAHLVVQADETPIRFSDISAEHHVKQIDDIKKAMPEGYTFQSINEYKYNKTGKGVTESYTVRSTKKGETGSYYEATATFINHELVDIN